MPPQRIDILTSVSGVDFEAAWQERLPIVVENLTVSVIGLRHLYENKLACGRDKDVVDANGHLHPHRVRRAERCQYQSTGWRKTVQEVEASLGLNTEHKA